MTNREIEAKLWRSSIIEPVTNCWLWKGARNQLGYGRIAILEEDNKFHNRYVHIESFKIFHGFPNPLVLHKDQVCNHKNCWNPEHLYSGNHSQNKLDSIKKHGHPLRDRIHCLNGHEYTKENTKVMKNGHRTCRECFRIRNEKLKIQLQEKRKRG